MHRNLIHRERQDRIRQDNRQREDRITHTERRQDNRHRGKTYTVREKVGKKDKDKETK